MPIDLELNAKSLMRAREGGRESEVQSIMGGYGSGRRKRHHITYEGVPIDTMSLLKRGLLTGEKLSTGAKVAYTIQAKDLKGKVTETHHALYVRVKRYPEDDQAGEFACCDAIGQVTLLYGVKVGGEDQGMQRADIPLMVTHPNYGGVRYWLLAPCCGRRVRMVYLPIFGVNRVLPECRTCLDLHYASQMQSYVERCKTYEKHLLANYGWVWAELEYHSLREHYLEITPEIEYSRQRSIIDMRMRMLRLLMSFTRVMLRTHMYNLRSLKSEEDRRVYLEHVVEQHGESFALDLVRMLGISVQVERGARESSSEVFDQAYEQVLGVVEQGLQSDGIDPDTQQAIEDVALNGNLNMRYLLAYKQTLEEDIKELEKMKPAA
jgi:hypothetical protein